MMSPEPTLTVLDIIKVHSGDVRHGLKRSDFGYTGFGEAYLSIINQDKVKGWRRHKQMTLNIVVVIGEIRFVIYNNKGFVRAANLTPDRPSDYKRLTVPPGYWMAFGGVRRSNMLLNVADIEHKSAEVESAPIEQFTWSWKT